MRFSKTIWNKLLNFRDEHYPDETVEDLIVMAINIFLEDCGNVDF